MKVEIISRDDIAEGLVYDLWREGVGVYYHGKNRYVFSGMDGIVKTKNYEDVDYYIFDDTLFGLQIEKMRKDGKAVVGGNRIGDKLELDRFYFYEQMKKIGVNVPETHAFKTISDGIDFLKEQDGKWVFKPSGKWSDEKSLTYIGDDLVEFMENLRKTQGDKHDYVLQKFINGTEVAITGMVIDGRVIGGYFINFEFKPFLKYSNLNTGEVGTIVKYYDGEVGVLSEYLRKVAELLGDYRCWFDLNGILTDDGKYYVLEPTSRFGIPIMSILHSMLDENIGEFYEKVANGELENFQVKDDWFVGIVLAVPPFPYHIPNQWQISQLPIRYGRMEDRHVHYYEIMKKGDEYWTSGDSGFVAVVVGSGKDWKEANKNAVQKCRDIDIPEKFFRSDLGEDDRPAKFEEVI